MATLNRALRAWRSWLAPAFFALLALVFLVTPGTTLDKLNLICFGI